MKYSCNLIRDLLPLYCDEVCSEESKEAVEVHMEECEGCRTFYDKMKQEAVAQDPMQKSGYEDQQIASMKKIRKRWKKRNIFIGLLGIIVGAAVGVAALKLLEISGLAGLLVLDGKFSKVEVHEEIGDYQKYIGLEADEKYRDKWGMEDWSIFPAEITNAMEVKDFKFVYYNPWDAQYLSYLAVEYDTDEAYQAECKRLEEEPQEKYVGYYGVTGEPEGYSVLAMNSDSYQGFVYALTPADISEDYNGMAENGRMVIYVEIIFCNYFLDLNVYDYVPEEYILTGFDASSDNPYRKKMLKDSAPGY